MTSRHRACHRGFTLVELLVVIAIIGILASLALVGIRRAVVAAQNGAMNLEIKQISQALNQYKIDSDAYPPDCNSVVYSSGTLRANAITSHLRRRFPKRSATDYPTANATNLTRLINAGYLSPNGNTSSDYQLSQLDPTEVYVLFLMGFSSDITNPITGTGDRTPLFKFDTTRLVDTDNDGWWSFKPKYSDSEIVYFNAYSYDTFPASPGSYAFNQSASVAQVNFDALSGSLATGIARPYGKVNANGKFDWVNNDTFQLLCAGVDGAYGGYYVSDPTVAANGDAVKIYPSGQATGPSSAVTYKVEDMDNITNFSEASTLGSDTGLAP
ncbi:prepilin-type N-terminal cleavage/methylation domain-containing protein [bacterium]|nr:prepilin-type N-terminal cleavage/methylation domain-containing protein [bacterium]